MAPAFNTTTEIPIWKRPASKASKASVRQVLKEADTQIPLFVKAPSADNFQKYISKTTVPLLQKACLVSATEIAAGKENGISELKAVELEVGGDAKAEPLEREAASSPKSLASSLRDARLRVQSTALSGRVASSLRQPLSDEFCGSTQELLAALRSARRAAARNRAARTSMLPCGVANGFFSVTINTIDGACCEVEGLHSDMQLDELFEVVAQRFGIPTFAVCMIVDDSFLRWDSSQTHLLLCMVGISPGTQLTLVKDFGWGKPDVALLSELAIEWCGRKH
jgi:hypothetical protein